MKNEEEKKKKKKKRGRGGGKKGKGKGGGGGAEKRKKRRPQRKGRKGHEKGREEEQKRGLEQKKKRVSARVYKRMCNVCAEVAEMGSACGSEGRGREGCDMSYLSQQISVLAHMPKCKCDRRNAISTVTV